MIQWRPVTQALVKHACLHLLSVEAASNENFQDFCAGFAVIMFSPNKCLLCACDKHFTCDACLQGLCYVLFWRIYQRLVAYMFLGTKWFYLCYGVQGL